MIGYTEYREQLRRMPLAKITEELRHLKQTSPEDTLPKEHAMAWELLRRLELEGKE